MATRSDPGSLPSWTSTIALCVRREPGSPGSSGKSGSARGSARSRSATTGYSATTSRSARPRCGSRERASDRGRIARGLAGRVPGPAIARQRHPLYHGSAQGSRVSVLGAQEILAHLEADLLRRIVAEVGHMSRRCAEAAAAIAYSTSSRRSPTWPPREALPAGRG